MFKSLKNKIKESLLSVFPIVMIVLLISLTPFFNLNLKELLVFLFCSITMIMSIALFNVGAEISMTPMGEYIGISLVKKGKISFILIFSFLMGLFATIAEPDLMVLAKQLRSLVNEKMLIVTVGIGVGFFLMVAILKIIFHKSFAMLLLLFYALIFAFTSIVVLNDKENFIPLAFDSGGVTTGPITVPFIMAFGVGIASSIGGRDVNENSFGLISLCSIGPILVVLWFMLFAKSNFIFKLPDYSLDAILSSNIILMFTKTAFEVGNSLAFVFSMFLILNFFIIKLPLNKIFQIVIGILITYIGLVIFLLSASIGFLPIGFKLGTNLISAPKELVIAVGFIIGMTVVIAEPAVQVLNRQVEEITSGTVTRKSMMMALSIGVGISLVLSIIRIYYNFSILYILVPGYFISLLLSIFVPPIYTSIAFDSGGVASGPLTSTFILPFMIGICSTYINESSVLKLAFGVVALVAMTPLITIQILGFSAISKKYIRDKISMHKILRADDSQIVYIDVNLEY